MIAFETVDNKFMEIRKIERYWEVDFLRGIAVVLMVVLHAVDDYYFVSGKELLINSGIWYYWQQITAGLFLILVGVSQRLSYLKVKKPAVTARPFGRFLKKGLFLLAVGLMITLVTKMILKEGFIRFGILHLIGLAVIISYPLLALGYWNVGLGMLMVWAGGFISKLRRPDCWLLWLGVKPDNFYSIDYFPLIPWLGMVLFGIALGKFLYPSASRRFNITDLTACPVIRGVCIIGENSLVIYLLHQPVLLLIISFLYRIGTGFF